MRVFFDVCCLNRPFDSHIQPRVRRESESVIRILAGVEVGRYQLVSSESVDLEVRKNPDSEKRSAVQVVLKLASERIQVDGAVSERAQELPQAGFGSYDALHLACAERGQVDVFLTTDDRLVRRALRLAGALKVTVRYPQDWLAEHSNDDRDSYSG